MQTTLDEKAKESLIKMALTSLSGKVIQIRAKLGELIAVLIVTYIL